MHYLNISFSHKNSTLEIREKLTYPDETSKRACLVRLTSSGAVNEVILISTCNRMEVFCSCNDISEATKHILSMLSARSGIEKEELEGRADIFDDSSAIHHLFSVASSLDSMVVGETQIAGQLKDAFRFSYDNGFCSQKLARAMHHAFKCAAKVRQATDISSKPVSIASVAVAKLKSVLNSMAGKKALVIGVGEMSEISAKHLKSSGADVYIMNRTKENAIKLANECGVGVLEYEGLKQAVAEFEIIFSATSAPHAIITDEIIKGADFDRYWFDLAVPRDIIYSKGERINLYTIDDLRGIVEENRTIREDEARKAHTIIGRSTVDFFEWLDTQNIEPMIKEIYQKAYEAARVETARVMDKNFIPREYEAEARKLAEQSLKRFLHEMIAKMRSTSEDARSDMITNTLQFLITRDDVDVMDKYKCEHDLTRAEGRR
ncbi:MAG: glutamyl-tRNA reductase [Sulfuricurvum sp.]